MQYCTNCGKPIEPGMRFCVYCGNDLLDVARTMQSASEPVTESESRPGAQPEPVIAFDPGSAPVFEWSPQPAQQPTPTSVWQMEPQPGEDMGPNAASQPKLQVKSQSQTVQKWRPTPQPQPTPQPHPMSQPTPTVQPIARHIPQPMPDPSAPASKKSSKGALIAVICIVVAAAGLFAVYHFGIGGALQQQTQTAPAAAPSTEIAPDAGTTSNEQSEAPVAVSSPSNQQNVNQQTPSSQQAPSDHQYSSQPNVTPPAESKPVAPPVFTYTDASSVLPGDEVTSYYGPNNVVDNDFMTAWNEGVDGGGIGEWVSINAAEPQRVSGVRIVNGYPKTGDIFKGNHRCRDVTILLSDGYEQHVTLKDSYREYQTFNFDKAHDTTFVRVRIDSIYQGAKWDDTPICELQAF